MSETKCEILNVTFTLQEIKQLVIDYIDLAQNVTSYLFIPRLKSYTELHTPLVEFYKIHKNNKPTMADKLCFVILLSYTKQIVQNLNDISDINLFSHENTDFIYKEELTLNHEENENDRYDCICSYERLQTIHFVENKYSGMTLQVGSECIKKYKLISKEELKKFKETEKIMKIRRQEINEGKPIGYYEEEKQRKKEEKQRKKEEKQQEQKQTKINTGNYKRCYHCTDNLVDIRKQHLCICIECKRDNCTELLHSQIKKYSINECENCYNHFIDLKGTYLCKSCKIENKVTQCCMPLCQTLMVVNINENNVYCDECEKKITSCIDCKKKFIKNDLHNKCQPCQFAYKNKFVSKLCVCCNEEMIIKETELWRTYCNVCYIDIQETIKTPPNCNCGLAMCEKTIRKEGINKGRKGLGCSKFPNGCNKFIML